MLSDQDIHRIWTTARRQEPPDDDICPVCAWRWKRGDRWPIFVVPGWIATVFVSDPPPRWRLTTPGLWEMEYAFSSLACVEQYFKGYAEDPECTLCRVCGRVCFTLPGMPPVAVPDAAGNAFCWHCLGQHWPIPQVLVKAVARRTMTHKNFPQDWSWLGL